MKTTLPFLLLLFSAVIVMACSASKNRNAAAQKWISDTLVTVHVDTVVMFDPKTYQETWTVKYRYDTTIVRKEK